MHALTEIPENVFLAILPVYTIILDHFCLPFKPKIQLDKILIAAILEIYRIVRMFLKK